MWFNPSELSIKEIIPPATFATSATLEVESSKVARVADPLPVKTNNSGLEISKLAELAAPNNHTSVICYTPNGNPIKVQATSTAHAEFLQRMNPKPQEINK